MRIELDAPAPRLDRFLSDRFPEVNRTRWEAWIREGGVRVNGSPALKPGTRLRAGDLLETELPEVLVPALHLVPEALDLPTLYEDARLWIVDKPAGMVVHPGPGHPSGTVLNALLSRLAAPWEAGVAPGAPAEDADGEADGEDEGPSRTPMPGLVHRLDRYTTGCLAMAKDAEAQAALMAQFKDRTVEKRYLALVRQSPKLPLLGSLLVDEPIARHRTERVKMCIAAHGRPSRTRIHVLARSASLALVECELLTGRTHQIRVHLAHLRAPILGDPMYGGPARWQDLERQPFECPHPALHAWKLVLDHPDGRRLAVEAPLPPAFEALLARLGMAHPT